MIDYQELLKTNPCGVLATQNGSGLDTRVLHSIFTEGNKVYFSTGSDKPLCSQLTANCAASFCCYPQNYSPVLTLNGKVTFVDDIAFKTRVMKESDMVKGNYKTPDNPAYKLFYLEVEEVKTYTPGMGTERTSING